MIALDSVSWERKSGKVCLANGERLVFVDEQMRAQSGDANELGNEEVWEGRTS